LIIGAGFLTILTFAICDKSFKGSKKMFLITLYSSIAGFLVLLVLHTIVSEPYRWQRILIMLNPELDPNGAGYQNMLLDKLLSSSKFIGCSDVLAAYKLPGGNSEFIFTYVVSRFGWLLGAILILLLSLFILRLFSAANKITDRYGKYLCIGICCVFPLQVAANILMNLGFFPITGISLPFISYGGGNFVCNMALIGLLLGVYRRKDIIINETASTI
jgi:cell division protein FtsW (lipid II flippase)